MTRAWARWVPALLVPAVVAAGALVNSTQAGAAPDLPAKSASEVLAMFGASTLEAFSGTIEQASALGLPALPAGAASLGSSGSSGSAGSAGSAGSTASAAALELLTGAHTARVYVDGPTKVRVQVLDQLAERDLVRSGSDVWFYSSADNAATHLVLPPSTSPADATEVTTPPELAKRLVAAIDPSTELTVDRATTIAGRDAYTLTLRPRSDATLVGSASIAVDAATGLALSVDVRARGQADPAFVLAFTSLSLDRPNAERFAFTPPAGATVEEQTIGAHGSGPRLPGSSPDGASPDDASSVPPTLSGTGWETVVEVPSADVPAELSASPLLTQATRAVAGGRFLHTALVNVLLTNDGRVLLGSVPLERLESAAAGR